MEINEEINAFLKAKEHGYTELLKQARQACCDVRQELGGAVVRSVYDRGEKQATGIFKSCDKIAKPLVAERRTRPSALPSEVQDIIGLTVVVHYPDEITVILERLKLKIKNAAIVKDTPVVRNGYHAHHAVFRSDGTRSAGLHCEIQIKTMLHDAWSAKTHDLNYKPRGHTDFRLSRMMQVFGDALQSIEAQSELLRDMIHERWNTDIGPRQAVKDRLFEYVPNWRKRKKFSAAANSILREMKKGRIRIKATAPDDEWLSNIVKKINNLGEGSLREAAWLSIQLAMIKGDDEYIHFANGKAMDLAINADRLLSQNIVHNDEIETLPLAVSAYGDNAKAIELSKFLLRECTALTVNGLELLRFNLANSLVEQAIDGPALSKYDRESLRCEVRELIDACVGLRARDPSSFLDLDGLLIVATSDDPLDLEKAIDLIQQGRDQAPESDRSYAEACYKLNIRLAWRRLLELEGNRGRPVPA